jgi:sortase (surface protein transpeptidase)
MTSRRALLSLLVLAAFHAACDGSSSGNARPTPEPTSAPASTPRSLIPTHIPSNSSIPVRLRIESIDVDANVIVLGVDENRIMETPDSPVDVAWYDFSDRPGATGNAVFSGHVDYINFGPAVFWDLQRLRPDDIIDVEGENGTVLSYAVVWSTEYLANPTQAELEEIVGNTPVGSVTLMTEAGAFDGTQYTHRLVVRAEIVSAP